MSAVLRWLGLGAKKTEIQRSTVFKSNFRLKKPEWAKFVEGVSPGMSTIAAAVASRAGGPQVVVKRVSDLEVLAYVVAPSGSEMSFYESLASAPEMKDALAPLATQVGATESHDAVWWSWAGTGAGLQEVTVTKTCFDVRAGSYDDFISQFESQSHKIRPHAEETGILWQAAYFKPQAEENVDKVALLSVFENEAGPRSMGPRLPKLYADMGLSRFMAAQPQIDTSAHGSYLNPVDSPGFTCTAEAK